MYLYSLQDGPKIQARSNSEGPPSKNLLQESKQRVKAWPW